MATQSFVRVIMWSITNIARHKNLKLDDANLILAMGAIGLHIENEEIKSDALWSIYYASENDDSNLHYLVNSNEIMIRVLELLKDKHCEVFIPAMRIVGNVLTATNSDDLVNYYLGLGLLNSLHNISTVGHTNIIKELLWILSNLMAGPPSHINAVLESPLIDRVIILTSSNNIELRKEALWCVCNALTTGDDICA